MKRNQVDGTLQPAQGKAGKRPEGLLSGQGRGAWLAGLLMLSVVASPSARSAWADGEGPGHMHGPDGRHIAAPAERGEEGSRILSHHDLRITDTRAYSLNREGAVVEGAEVDSVIHRKGDPNAVVHREHNAYEPENGVYGSHMMYREPGEYVIVEKVTLPDGQEYTLEFPIWVPDPAGASGKGAFSPLLLALVALGGVGLIAAAFLAGRQSGRRAAAKLSVFVLVAGLAPAFSARADGEGPGHAHGPDGRHIAVPQTSGTDAPALRAYLGPKRETEAVQTRDRYRFRLSIENEELEEDPDLVTLEPAAAGVLDLRTARAVHRPLAGGLSVTGQVRPNPDGLVTVSSRVAGRVVRVTVQPGQQVRAGQVVAVIDSTEVAEVQAGLARAAAEVRQAEAAVDRARAEVRRMSAAAREAEAGETRVQAQHTEALAEVDHERAEVEVARGKVAAAEKTLARQRQLAAAGAFAQAPVEAARSRVTAAEGEQREAQVALENLEAQARRLEQGLKDGVVARKEWEAAHSAAAQGRTRLRTAERQVEIARTALAREERILKENLRDAREVQEARAAVEAAQLALKLAQAGFVRQERAAETARALVEAQARATLTARAQIAGAQADQRRAEAALRGSREAVRAAASRLRLLQAVPGGGSQVALAAPLSGEVHTRPVAAGQVVAPGEAVCTISNTATVWVESDVFEKDLPRVREGQKVSLATEAVPGKTFEGLLDTIENEVDAQTRAVHVRTVVPNPGGLLKPNMFVRVIISPGQGQVVTVPLEALQERGSEQVVFVEESAGTYRKRTVRAGAVLGDQVVIEAGLKTGEKVVTRGAYQLLAKLR